MKQARITRREVAEFLIRKAEVKNPATVRKIEARIGNKPKEAVMNAYTYVTEGTVTAAQAIHIMTGIILA